MSGGRSRAALAQNLFRGDGPARTLVRAAAIQPGDLAYDLGAGTGRVTSALLAAGARVVAVERDPNLARKLRARFEGRAVSVVEADLADTRFAPPFKVVANLPFNQTAATLRRLLFEAPAPEAATLVLQREAADKFAGLPRPTLVSLTAQPWWEIRLSRPFTPADFVPAPRVDVAVLHILRRRTPLLGAAHRARWEALLRHVFARGSREARRSFRGLFSNLQWRRLSADLGITEAAALADLTLEQWLALYRFALSSTPPAKQRRAFEPVRTQPP